MARWWEIALIGIFFIIITVGWGWALLGADPRWQNEEFVGSAMGSATALLFLLFGALYNAELNRRRDDRLKDQQARSMAAAIRSEISSLRVVTSSLFGVWEENREDIAKLIDNVSEEDGLKPSDMAEYGRLPIIHFSVFEANAGSLGLIGWQLAAAVSVIYSNYRVRAEAWQQPLPIPLKELPELYREQLDWGRYFCQECWNVEQFLAEFERTGRPPVITDPSGGIDKLQAGRS